MVTWTSACAGSWNTVLCFHTPFVSFTKYETQLGCGPYPTAATVWSVMLAAAGEVAAATVGGPASRKVET